MIISRGSQWNKWDLHLHTPSSFDYDDKTKTDQEIIDALKANGIVCAAITDHHAMDVTRIKNLQSLGKKEGILILPGMEIRGDKRHKEPINLIAIFSEDSDINFISNELLSKLDINDQRITRKRSEEEIYVDIFLACDLIHKLEGLVTVHAGNKSSSIEKCYPNALPEAVAEKIDFTDRVDIFEIATFNDVRNYKEKVFPKIGKSYPIIKTSDNHDSANYEFPEGMNCWIKADVSFEGLKQITYEPDARVFIGNEPPILQKVVEKPTRFIDRIKITQVGVYDQARGVWFKDIDIPLNPEMVAIIGNKGSGKSALADIIGLVGESKNIGNASFLVPRRFKKPGLARNFEAELTWASGDIDSKNLYDDLNDTEKEKVKYLPQRWFEELTNELDNSQFSSELEKVVYTHLNDAERLGHDSFQSLIQDVTSSVSSDITELQQELHRVNVRYVDYLRKLHPDYEKEIQSGLAQKRRELEAHLKIEPKKEKNPDQTGVQEKSTNTLLSKIGTLDTNIERLGTEIKKSTDAQVLLSKKVQSVANLREEISRLKRTVSELLSAEKIVELFGDDALEVVTLLVDEKKITQIETQIETDLTSEREKSMDEMDIDLLDIGDDEKLALKKKSLKLQLDNSLKERDELKATLEQPQKLYQRYLEDYRSWVAKKLDIEGEKEDPQKDTINYSVNELGKIKGVYPTELLTLSDKQFAISRDIFEKKQEIVLVYRNVKSKVDTVIEKNRPKVDDYIINIEAGFVLSGDFRSNILDSINLRTKGSFMVRDAGFGLLARIIEDRDINTLDNVSLVQKDIISNLSHDTRSEVREEDKVRYLIDQVPNPTSLLDYLYGLDYLNENYQLRLDNKNLESLSPGEKGALLLVFYLMLDLDDIPLIIDQPEDNLDNQSVSKILVEFIKGAKTRRQIILVTHNPNLAVVSDAEQVIYTHLDKTKNHTFTIESGSIENDIINGHIVNVLEGTMPAFDKRRLRYKGSLK